VSSLAGIWFHGHWLLAVFGHHLLSLASTHLQLVCLTIGFDSPDIALAWTQQKTQPPMVPLLLSWLVAKWWPGYCWCIYRPLPWWFIIYRLLTSSTFFFLLCTSGLQPYVTVYLVMVYYIYICTAWILPYVFRHNHVDTERDIGFHSLDTSVDAFPHMHHVVITGID
jgi:hypothetical protein